MTDLQYPYTGVVVLQDVCTNFLEDLREERSATITTIIRGKV